MLRIIITAKTEIGKKAIEQHIEDSKKAKAFVKAQWKFAGFDQMVTNENPKTLTVLLKNRKLLKDHFIMAIKGEIQDGLLQNGATWETDYSMDVENGE